MILNVKNGYIVSFSSTTPDTDSEYQRMLDIYRHKPTPPEGKGYRLTESMDWELYDLPPVEPVEDPEEINRQKAEAYDILMGGGA